MPSPGRPQGSRNKISAQVRKAAIESGITPLEYMLKVMRNTKAERARRDEMAKAAAPYVHPRLAAVDTYVSGTLTLKDLVEQSLRVPEPANANDAGIEEKDTDTA